MTYPSQETVINNIGLTWQQVVYKDLDFGLMHHASIIIVNILYAPISETRTDRVVINEDRRHTIIAYYILSESIIAHTMRPFDWPNIKNTSSDVLTRQSLQTRNLCRTGLELLQGVVLLCH
jgi:hypothetical protein